MTKPVGPPLEGCESGRDIGQLSSTDICAFRGIKVRRASLQFIVSTFRVFTTTQS